MLLSQRPFAAECIDVFPSALANSADAGSITGNYWGAINNSTVLTTKQFNDNGNVWLCGNGPCSKSNTNAATATNFTSFPGGADLNIGSSGNAYYSSSTNFNNINTSYNSWLNLSPGDYTVNGNVNLGNDSFLNIYNYSGTVRIFINGNLNVASNAQINIDAWGGSSEFFYIYVRGTVTLQAGSDTRAIIYAKGAVNLQSGSSDNYTLVNGAITSEAGINLSSYAGITYESSYIAHTNFGAACTKGIYSFAIDAGTGTASTCSARAVTITARNYLNSTLTSYTGSVSISTSTNKGDWAKTSTAANANGTLSAGSSDSGAATYTFTGADAGDIILNLTNTHAQSLTITVNDSSAGRSNTSSSITFADNVFDIAASDTLGDDLIAGRSHLFTATMMKKDPTTGNCSAATGYNVAGVKMWLTRHAADPAGNAPTASNNGNTSSAVLSNSEPGANNINLNFSSGVANFRLLASDVGKYSLNIKDSSNSFASAAISGSSATFVARPFGFYISAAGNPAASSAAGSKYKKAGEAFSSSITAVAWQSADDANDDGIADGHQDTNPGNNANLANNSVVAKFGAESSAETALLSAALNAPATGNNPGLGGTTNFSGFSSGTKTSTNLTFNNVGIIELAAAVGDGDYLGAGTTRTNKMVTRSGYVGRFYPSAFSLSNIQFHPACELSTQFSYLAQPFSFTANLTALTETGATASNYIDDFVKFSSDQTSTFKSVDPTAATALSSRISMNSQSYSWSNGVLSANVSASINRAAASDGPYTNARFGWAPVDSDSTALLSTQLNLDSDLNSSNDSALLGSQHLRLGRLRLDNAHGPETARLPAVLHTEYWNGSYWAQNLADSCTQLNLSAITYPNGAISTPANRTITLGAGTTTGQYTNLSASTLGFSQGDAGQYFSAPGTGNTGSFMVDINLSNYSWLRFDWNGDNTPDISVPSAQYTFGNYRGNDKMLIWLE